MVLRTSTQFIAYTKHTQLTALTIVLNHVHLGTDSLRPMQNQ